MQFIDKKKAIIILSLGLIAFAFYIQLGYNREAFLEKGFLESDLSKDVVTGKGATFVNSSLEKNDFFSRAKLDRDITFEKVNASVKEVINNANLSEEAKKTAVDQMSEAADRFQKEAKIETLIKEKGFSDAFVSIAQDGSADLIVKAPSLTEAEVAQISDIASRHADINIEQIHIKNKY